MRRQVEIEKQEQAMDTLAEITSVFEGIASMRITQIKNQVLQATKFFSELWNIYTQLRVDTSFRFGRSSAGEKISDKELFIIITAEGGFSGDIDEKLVDDMLKAYDPNKQDIIVIGHHGALQLAQAGVSFKKYFRLPVRDQNFNVEPIVKEVQTYKTTTAFYQQYISLMVQDIRRIELLSVVNSQARLAGAAEEEVISEVNYIFEPSTYDVVDHLESSMTQIAVSQLILDSKLAQYASRFRAMSAAHEKADETKSELHLDAARAKRAVKDERLKEIVNGLRYTEKTL